MVYFTCNHCGDSLPKPKVEKHYQTACSRNPINVTCFDCHKDFRENEYVGHTKCVTEMERYSDKNYVAKPNKGEQKQSAWIDAVQSVIRDTVNAKPAVKEILKKIAAHDNVPRKKVKFLNFMRNCGGVRTKDDVLEEVWSLLEEKQKELKSDDSKSNGQNSEKKEIDDSVDEKPADNATEKKKKRKLEESKAENTEKELENGKAEMNESETKENDNASLNKKPKLDKNKANGSPIDEKPKENGKGKKKKRKLEENDATAEQKAIANGDAENHDSESKAESNNESPSKKPILPEGEQISKFEWKKEILDCLNSNNNEISMKKLRKSIIENYIAAVDFDKYFMKKLNKIKGLTIKDDVVKLDN